ncbi:MAG: TrkA family potassium uptake protein [Eubacteriales bacterium]|nr:TrkA family potassium uptake protein [Eubacteriales bacterium]
MDGPGSIGSGTGFKGEGIMNKSFLIIGLGRFGQSTARMLTMLGHEVLAVDKRADRVSAIKESVMHAVQADTTDERAVAQLGIRNFDCVVICIGDDIRASVLATVLCREMGAKKIVAKAQDDLHQKLLIKTGADRVVQPEHDGGIRLARSLVAEGVLDSLDLSEEYSINEVEIPRDWVGRSLAQIDVRNRYGVSVIAIRREGHVSVNIDPSDPFLKNDSIYLLGDDKSLERISG